MPPPRTPVRPVARRILLGVVALVVLALVLAIEATDLLRHPPTGGEAPLAEVDADPRIEVECPAVDLGERLATDFLPEEPEVVGSNDLYDCPAVYGGRPVVYEGEVVGAVLRRGEHAWVHLNDDVYSGEAGQLPAHRDYQGGNAGVGVRIPAALAAQVTFVGGPSARGDRLRVEGVFHRVHPGTREPAVIVASRGELVAAGEPFVDPVLRDRAVAALVLGPLALLLIVIERVVARRRKG